MLTAQLHTGGPADRNWVHGASQSLSVASLMQPGLSPSKSQGGSADFLRKSSDAQLAGLEVKLDQLQAEVRADKQTLLGQLQMQHRHVYAGPTSEQQKQLQQICQNEAALLRADFANALKAEQQRVDSNHSSQHVSLQQSLDAQAIVLSDLQQDLQDISSTCASAAEHTASQALAAQSTTLQIKQQQIQQAQAEYLQAARESRLAAEISVDICKASLEASSSAALAKQQEQAAQQQAACRTAAHEAANACITAASDAQQKAAAALQEECRNAAVSAAESWLEQALQPVVEALQEAWQQSLDRTTSSVQADLSEVRQASSKGISETALQMRDQLDAALSDDLKSGMGQIQTALLQELSQSKPPGAASVDIGPALLHPIPEGEEHTQEPASGPMLKDSQAAQHQAETNQNSNVARPTEVSSRQASTDGAKVMSQDALGEEVTASAGDVSSGCQALPDVSSAVATQQHQVNGLLAEVG